MDTYQYTRLPSEEPEELPDHPVVERLEGLKKHYGFDTFCSYLDNGESCKVKGVLLESKGDVIKLIDKQIKEFNKTPEGLKKANDFIEEACIMFWCADNRKDEKKRGTKIYTIKANNANEFEAICAGRFKFNEDKNKDSDPKQMRPLYYYRKHGQDTDFIELYEGK